MLLRRRVVGYVGCDRFCTALARSKLNDVRVEKCRVQVLEPVVSIPSPERMRDIAVQVSRGIS
jgi:hypothetical protein